MKKIQTLLVLAFVFCALLPLKSWADIVIVAGSGSSLSTASSADVMRLYLGKSKSIGGTSVTPLNQLESADITASFNRTLLNKSNSQVKAYWSKLVFTGKGTPPEALTDDAAVIAELKSNADKVGYINSASVTADVKVILTL